MSEATFQMKLLGKIVAILLTVLNVAALVMIVSYLYSCMKNPWPDNECFENFMFWNAVLVGFVDVLGIEFLGNYKYKDGTYSFPGPCKWRQMYIFDLLVGGAVGKAVITFLFKDRPMEAQYLQLEGMLCGEVIMVLVFLVRSWIEVKQYKE